MKHYHHCLKFQNVFLVSWVLLETSVNQNWGVLGQFNFNNPMYKPDVAPSDSSGTGVDWIHNGDPPAPPPAPVDSYNYYAPEIVPNNQQFQGSGFQGQGQQDQGFQGQGQHGQGFQGQGQHGQGFQGQGQHGQGFQGQGQHGQGFKGQDDQGFQGQGQQGQGQGQQGQGQGQHGQGFQGQQSQGFQGQQSQGFQGQQSQGFQGQHGQGLQGQQDQGFKGLGQQGQQIQGYQGQGQQNQHLQHMGGGHGQGHHQNLATEHGGGHRPAQNSFMPHPHEVVVEDNLKQRPSFEFNGGDKFAWDDKEHQKQRALSEKMESLGISKGNENYPIALGGREDANVNIPTHVKRQNIFQGPSANNQNDRLDRPNRIHQQNAWNDKFLQERPADYYKGKINPDPNTAFLKETFGEFKAPINDKNNRQRQHVDGEQKSLGKQRLHRLEDPPAEIIHKEQWFQDEGDNDSNIGYSICTIIPSFFKSLAIFLSAILTVIV